jgi:PAS domain S-box-containing protein
MTSSDRAPGGVPLAEEALRRLVELAPDVLIAHRNGKVVWANEAAARLIGVAEPAALVGRSVLDFVAPESDELVRSRIARMQSGTSPEPLASEVILRADGSRVDVEVTATPVVDGVILVAGRDVTARLAAERSYRDLFDRMPVGVWIEDLSGVKRMLDALGCADGEALRAHLLAHPEVLLTCSAAMRVIEVNATAVAMAGARDAAQLMANLDKIFVPEAAPDLADELVQLHEGRRGFVAECWNGTIDGGRRWVAVRGELLRGHEHDWSRALVIVQDMTDRRRLHEERAALRERLLEAEKLEAVGRLAGGVAHDFNNILAAVLGFAEATLEETERGSSIHDAQLHIRDAALRARDLVKQILTVGRRDRPEPRPVDAAAVVTAAMSLARAAIPATVEVRTSVDPGAGVVLADPTQLHQIVLNLLSNARDAVGARGLLEVRLEAKEVTDDPPDLAPGRWIRLRVKDDGVGMDDALRARIFEPYLTTKGRTGGHGLGLAVVHGIVTAARGAIRVESSPGRGSTFDVWLPVAEGAVVPVPPARPERAPGRGERILVVDDEPLVRSACSRLLRSLGYEVAEAPDGLAALELIRRDATGFDLVLTDQTMPRLSGADLARALLAELPGARIVLCSGYADAVDEARARAIGLRGLLAKPIERDALAEAVRAALAPGP